MWQLHRFASVAAQCKIRSDAVDVSGVAERKEEEVSMPIND